MSDARGWPEVRRIVPTRHGQAHARLRGVDERPDRGGAVAESARPLVLLHMSPRSRQMYVALQARLRRPSVARDRLGYGFSDPPARPLSMTEYAESAVEAVDFQCRGECAWSGQLRAHGRGARRGRLAPARRLARPTKPYSATMAPDGCERCACRYFDLDFLRTRTAEFAVVLDAQMPAI